MPKLKLNLPNDSRRSFRLAPLELLLGGLIIVGLLYLATIWVGGMLAPEPEAASQARASMPAGQSAALASSTKAAMRRVKDLDRRMAALSSRLDQLAAAEKKAVAKSPAGLERRLSGLEKRVAALGKGRQQVRAPVADPKLSARLDALDKSVAALSKARKAAPPPAPDPKLAARLAALDQAQRQREAAAATLAARVAALDKSIAALDKRAQQGRGGLQSNATRLAALEQRVKALGGAVKARPAGGEPQLAARLTTLENQLAVLRRGAAPQQTDISAAARLSHLEQKIAGLQKAAAQTPATDAQLARRISSLERNLTQLRSRQRVVRAPVVDQESQARQERLNQQLRILEKRQQALDASLRRLAAATPARPKAAPARVTAAPARPQAAPARQQAAPARKAASEGGGPAKKVVHVVTRGQTLYGLARRYGVHYQQIRDWNPRLKERKSRDKLYIGEKLVIYARKVR